MVGNAMLAQRECFLPQRGVGWNAQNSAACSSLKPFTGGLGSSLGWYSHGHPSTALTPGIFFKAPQRTHQHSCRTFHCSDVSGFNLVLPFNEFGELPGSLPNGPPCTVNIRLTLVCAQGGRPGRESWGLPGFGPGSAACCVPAEVTKPPVRCFPHDLCLK